MEVEQATFLRKPAQLTRVKGHAGHGAKSRGFTLIEMMVVVIIITLMASIALPGISRQMENHRTKQAAELVSGIYRGARLRSLGRGSAVLVRYTAGAGTSGTFQTMEAIEGATAPAGCGQLPEASCLNPAGRWVDTSDRQQPLQQASFGEGYNLVIAPRVMVGGTATAAANVDVCFAPSGKSFIWSNVGADTALTPMTLPVVFDLTRTDGVGFQRSVVVTPNGNARVVAF